MNAGAAQVARLGIDQQATAGAGHTPGLMVGQAGTGLFYLSLTHSTTRYRPHKLKWKNTALRERRAVIDLLFVRILVTAVGPPLLI